MPPEEPPRPPGWVPPPEQASPPHPGPPPAQAPYGQPQYGQPQYPGYGPPPQPPYGQPQYPGYGPQYGRPQYGQPQYGGQPQYPGYGPQAGPWGWTPPPRPKGGSASTGPLPLHPMTVSDILDGAFKLLKGNLRTIAIVAAVFVVPVQLLAGLVQRASGLPNLLRTFSDPTAAQASNGTDGSVIVASAVVTLLGLLTAPFIAGAISRVVSASYVGAEEAPKAALAATMRRTWPLLASFVLVHVLEAIGGVLCILPGLAVMTMFVLVAPAIVIEGLGPIRGMKRSWQLVKGRFWATLGIALLAGLLANIVTSAVTVPFTVGSAILGSSGWIISAVGGVLAGLIARPFVAVVATLQYYDARIRTEGFDLQMLVAKLDRGR